ncbi:MAG: VWA domain-containing protein [Alphaproteobacteria bacterium]|nr:VWA domain-containing protein [Alphaproteobacteria bacterium]
MTALKNKIRMMFEYYRSDITAAIAIAFALMAPIIIGAAGMALDYAQAYLVQQRLAQAIDAAALAAAAGSTDPTEINQRVQDFFDVNYPPEKLGITFDPYVVVNGDEVYVSGNAYYDTIFLKIVGIEEIDVSAETTVQREVQGLEVAMVLDNTGSMANNNNIEALKDASEAFINILFDRTSNPNYIRIGMVPYANTVRVGRYGLGLKPDGSDYDGEPFVTLPPGMSYTTDHSSANWYGCVVEHNDNGYTALATHVSGSKGQLWEDTGSNPDGHGWDPRDGNNDPYDYDVLDDYEGPWDVYAYGRVISNNQKCSDYGGYSNSRCSDCTGGYGRCDSDYCFCWRSDSNQGTNLSCPYANIMPLTSDRDALIDHLDNMVPHGNTLGNIGMLWGSRIISPEAPFEEASDWDDVNWRKAVVMMTDGDNTRDGTYSSFWFNTKNNLGVSDYNERFEETCQALKDKGVTIYTVTFSSGINENTKGYYERCASSPDQHYDAPSQEDLIEVFETISRELSNLHIKG